MTRREAAEKVFAYIRTRGFEPQDIQYGNGYFIFDLGEDGVVHFTIKGLRNWKFGMWVNTDEEELKNDDGSIRPALQFFCQHIVNCDKFKPSRSTLKAEYKLKELESDCSWTLYEVASIIQFIKKKPFAAFAMDATESRFYSGSYIKLYLKSRRYYIVHHVSQFCNDMKVRVWHGAKVPFIRKYRIVNSVELFDGNDENWICYPRYEMIINFKKLYDDDDEQLRAELRVAKRWFKKNRYKNMNLLFTRDDKEYPYSFSET